MQITCPLCHQVSEVQFEVDDGQHLRCPYCNAKFAFGRDGSTILREEFSGHSENDNGRQNGATNESAQGKNRVRDKRKTDVCKKLIHPRSSTNELKNERSSLFGFVKVIAVLSAVAGCFFFYAKRNPSIEKPNRELKSCRNSQRTDSSISDAERTPRPHGYAALSNNRAVSSEDHSSEDARLMPKPWYKKWWWEDIEKLQMCERIDADGRTHLYGVRGPNIFHIGYGNYASKHGVFGLKWGEMPRSKGCNLPCRVAYEYTDGFFKTAILSYDENGLWCVGFHKEQYKIPEYKGTNPEHKESLKNKCFKTLRHLRTI